MAIEALCSAEKHFNHLPCHDLESMLYVIIYICTFTNGPNSLRPFSQLPEDLAIRSWFKDVNIASIGTTKVGHMECAAREILSGFTDYWTDFAPFVLELIKACFPREASVQNSLTYKGMIDILSRARSVVQEKPGSTGPSTIGRKRPSRNEDASRSKRGRRLLKHMD